MSRKMSRACNDPERWRCHVVFLPREQFRLLAVSEKLATYRFNRHEIDHHFCTICGVEPFAFSAPEGCMMAMIDAGTLDGVDI